MQDVGLRYINHLIEKKMYDDAARYDSNASL